MNQVSGILQQDECFKSYYPGQDTCSCGNCGPSTIVQNCGDDWRCNSQGCCPSCPDQPVCSKVNPNICPVIDDSFINAEWESPGMNNTGKIQCNYDSSKIKTQNGITTWLGVFGANDEYNQDIMPLFCSATGSTACQIDPTTGQSMAECSRLTSTNFFGDICAPWCDNNRDECNQTMVTYCQNADTPDCDCINRRNDPIYQAIKSSLPNTIPDGCWYRPCAGSNLDPYMIPTGVVPSVGQCPDGLCVTINEIVNKKGLDYTQAQEVLLCPIAPLRNVNNQLYETQTIILWIIVIFSIIILVILFIMIFKHRKYNNSIV